MRVLNSCAFFLLLLIAASEGRNLKQMAAAPSPAASSPGDVTSQVDLLLLSLCADNTAVPGGVNASQPASVALGATADALNLLQGILCNNGMPRSGVNATSLIGSVSALLKNVNSSSVSTLVEELFTNPANALGTLVDMLQGFAPNTASLIPVNGSAAAAGNATQPSLDLAALQPILKAIQADPAASQQLPNLLPLFLDLASGNTSAISSLNWTELEPVLLAIWKDPAARASIPSLLPMLESALGSLVTSKTGSTTLGGIVDGILAGLTNVAGSTGLLDLIFGAQISSSATPSPSSLAVSPAAAGR